MVLEGRVDELDLIMLAEKAQNIMTTRANKVYRKECKRLVMTPARGPAIKGKVLALGRIRKLNEIADEEDFADLGECREDVRLLDVRVMKWA